MKKTFLKLAAAVLVALGIGVATEVVAQAKGENVLENFKGKKVLIVYYSLSGNTRAIAGQIQELTGGDMFEIEPVTPYPSDYHATTEQAKKEIQSGVKPPIKNGQADLASYDVVFVGSPCWWSTIAPPVTTFLSAHDLSGKTVVPFSTHGGSGLARNASDTAKLTPHAKILDGKAFWGNRSRELKNEVQEWLKNLTI